MPTKDAIFDCSFVIAIFESPKNNISISRYENYKTSFPLNIFNLVTL